PGRALREDRRVRWLAAAALAVLLLLPAVLNSYAVTVFIFIFFYAFLGQAWNIVGGYAGQLSAGHAAFVGGLLVSVAESLGAVFLTPSLKELVSFSLLVLILLLRPAGLFGRRLT
ncbi:MAG TPA: hypothetical protein VFX28_20270, partial [Methylomirabilota bacterium]|nr:hypothetical protein [Methylomirabilota bacterium]